MRKDVASLEKEGSRGNVNIDYTGYKAKVVFHIDKKCCLQEDVIVMKFLYLMYYF